MLVIGLTGGSGCGKNEVAKILFERGIATIDTDSVYHGLVSSDSECTRELARAFGDDILNADGSLLRSRLAEIVFFDDSERSSRMKLLGDITHRYIKVETEAFLQKEAEKAARFAVIDAPVLFESGFSDLCDTTLAVLASRKTRLMRIMARDGISEARAEARLDAQPNDDFYMSRADFVIHNDGDLAALAKEVDRWLLYIDQK